MDKRILNYAATLAQREYLVLSDKIKRLEFSDFSEDEKAVLQKHYKAEQKDCYALITLVNSKDHETLYREI